MAPIKRKATTDERPSKRPKPDKKSTASRRDAIEERGAETSNRRLPAKSLLQQEEKSFPRGGASILTPIEQKQIKVQAEQDVLFEQRTGRTVGDDNDQGQLFATDATATGTKKRRKEGKHRDDSHRRTELPERSHVRIQGLSYKSLIVGSVVLGYVTGVTSRDVAVALANNLTGYVPITAISDRLNAQIEKLLDDEGDVVDDDEDVDLKKLFYHGQWIRATVTKIGSESAEESGRSKRHIELSVDPKQTNASLDPQNIVTSSMVQASVHSVEDHGLVMDLGLSDPDIKGFVSKKELGPAYKLDEVQEGQVTLCLVTGKASNGQVLKLSPDASRFSALTKDKNAPVVSEAPSIEAFQPGTAIEILISASGAGGIAGKVMGMLDVTADALHSGVGITEEDLSTKYKIGSKAKGRIIWTVPTDDGSRKIGVSLQDHLLALPPPPSKLPENTSAKLRARSAQLEHCLQMSAIVDTAEVKHVFGERGLLLTLPGDADQDKSAFAHIAQISDSRIEKLESATGPYKVGSKHRARILSYNPLDCLYYVSLKPSILDQPFLRIEDLVVGEFVRGTVEKLIVGTKGINGVLIKLSDNINGLVPDVHLSDVQLQHPERKFKEGASVKARILNVDLEKRYVRLTLKKSLVNLDAPISIWKDYAALEPGMEGKGTIVNLLPHGAAVQFFGNVRAWLPVAEMSETYIESPQKHFRLGQTVNARIISVDAESQEMKVSCKASSSFGPEQEAAWAKASGGDIIAGTVSEKSAESITVELEDGLTGLLRIGHLSDGNHEKAEKALRKLHVGQRLSPLLVLDKLERSRHLLLTRKPGMIEASQSELLIRTLQDAKEGRKVSGFIRNITPEAIFVEFANGVVGLMPKSQLSPSIIGEPSFGLRKDQSVDGWILNVSDTGDKFTLTMREPSDLPQERSKAKVAPSVALTNVADDSILSMADLTLGKVTKARIASIKATQINVRLADNVQGRIDVSEAFDSWEEITHKRAPLQKFKANETMEVKILGVHDARNHRFLPISHRENTTPVFELSAKRSRIAKNDDSGLSMDSVTVGSKHIAFINNHSEQSVWVNLSPNVRGRIALMDLSNEPGQLQNLAKSFPIGCALQVNVKHVDAAANRLDLVASSKHSNDGLTLQTISSGTIVAGRVTKLTERSITVQLSEGLAGPVNLVEMGDDYDQLNISQYRKNEIVRVCILDVDVPNKKIFLSLRPSKVLSSSLPINDPSITQFTQLKPGALIRGFVKHVGEKGVHVSLGAKVDAFVRISDLSDDFVKDWKSLVQVDQLVKCRILLVDADQRYALLSLKASHVDKDYKAPTSINDLKAGMTVTGKVRKVEDFGAFVDIDNTQPRLSGLCHRSEVAEKRVEDVQKLYSEGDVVKAKVLKVDVESRKISLGLKASYFLDEGSDNDAEAGNGEDVDIESDDVDVNLDGISEDDGGADIDLEAHEDLRTAKDDSESSSDADDMDIDQPRVEPTMGLKTSGFDWSGNVHATTTNGTTSESESEVPAEKKRKRHKAKIKEDLTGDLDKYGPRSISDFERQLLGRPNDSALWVQYMAFQLQLSEIQKARDIAERALRTIHIREVEEKANIWIAWLNLEVEFGDEESAENTFIQACQVQDPLEMHEKLASIYIDSGNHQKADATFEKIVSNKTFRASPSVWLNYATFLMQTLKEPTRARSLISRALQCVPTGEHRLLTAKFAALEFWSSKGDPERGRTIFEGLVTEWPNWSSGWDMFVDLERSKLTASDGADKADEARDRIRSLYERMAAQKMKKRRAKFVFKRWLEFEEAEGTDKSVQRVKALAKEYVERQQAKAGGDVET